ncbi:nicotinate-nucleotide-dimethylbenzimidazole phosphoribosyltransferase [Alcanivorax hongdengensis A-11-3]|uniref:Nicotinate-nucleotide--dimethylbenzimidazole phosphoribosyltransferase n=1 Tax=Alcanivorax hongdengensis A-11-3 TaxID=1177179 RepID=L0WER8_9GAMM|nr:nicotinate-nucleotide--dimethylbenzimidazole phosphoribosyltransferase [Alcanivorax hongdengensis]EKF75511.1 nicotinate-nucleotide-dimethylbenzimidazole phosphoribosyltransferase [Alcanivorax hongdengensis A-11-3]
MTDPAWQQPIRPPSQPHRQRALARQVLLTKPPGSLGQLESVAVTLAALQHSDSPDVDPIRIAVFAADHGVCDEGISAFPQAVTGQMIANFAAGGAAISVLARQLQAGLEVINLGTVTPAPLSDGVIDAAIAPGTANLARQPAMTSPQLQAALATGDRAAARAAEAGSRLFIGGEMGIGNTTSASAMACALLEQPPTALTGPGTGLDADGVAHKIAVIEQALQRHGQDREPLAVLGSLGGFEIAALAGAFIGCAVRGIPVLVDGFIVSVAALAAVRLRPELHDWLLFAHHSLEPGHMAVLTALDARPLLALHMRLGEGSGAAVAAPLLRSACALHNQMATFADAGVSGASE